MNKYSKLAAAIAALLMVTAIVVTFEACKKEKIASNIGNKNVEGIVYQQNVTDREAYIIDFKKQHLSGAKSDEVMSAENANAFLFDLLNFDFCDINGNGSDKTYETSTYTLNVSDGTIDLNEFADLYSQISQHVYDYYHSLNVENANYYCIIPEIDEFDSNATTTNVTVKTSLTSGLSYRNILYDSTLCDYFSGAYQWADAADTLTKYFNMSIYHPNLSERVFFTNESELFFTYDEFPQLYYCSGGCNVSNTMIGTDPMYYENTMCDLLNAYLDLANSHCPREKIIIEGVVEPHEGDPVLENIQTPLVLNHSLDVRYGIVTSTQIVVRL